MENDSIKGFKQEPYTFLSNMASFDKPVKIGKFIYRSSECYFQAMKTKDQSLREKISNMSPYQAKKFSKSIDPRGDWLDIRLNVMLKIVRIKFKLLSNFRDKLLETGDLYIEEINYWNDIYWGVCKGVGENHLGKILMKVREEIRKGDQRITGEW